MRISSYALFVVLAGAWPAAAQIVTNPDWLQKPEAEAMWQAFPRLAAQLGLGGIGTVSCQITVEGLAEQCEALMESPSGWGFGQAVVTAARSFRFRPKTLDGRAIPGGVVRVPIHFAAPITPERIEAAAYRTPATTDHRRELAREIVALRLETGTLQKAVIPAIVNDLAQPAPAGVDPALWQAAASAYRDATPQALADLTEAVVREYAAEYTEAELQRFAAMASKPGGRERALKAAHLKDGRVLTAQALKLNNAVRDKLCARWRCDIQFPQRSPAH